MKNIIFLIVILTEVQTHKHRPSHRFSLSAYVDYLNSRVNEAVEYEFPKNAQMHKADNANIEGKVKDFFIILICDLQRLHLSFSFGSKKICWNPL